MMLADFQEQVANAVAGALLLEPVIIEVEGRATPYDYRLHLSSDQIYKLLTEECSVFAGFSLAPTGYPDWVRISRPYHRSTYVLVVRRGEFESLGDMPFSAVVGTRGVSAADLRFTSFLLSKPENARWRRVPYPNNGRLIESLADGAIDGALVWEPAARRLIAQDSSSDAFSIIPTRPFRPPTMEFGLAMRSRDSYLLASLDRAIEALEMDGTLDRLREEHGVRQP